MKKIYLAALFSRRAEMEEIANKLRSYGYHVCSRWVFGGEDGLTREQISLVDIEDVDKCDVLISFTHPRGSMTSGGGRHVEFGYAMARGKELVIVGERENVFHHFPAVSVYENIDQFIVDDELALLDLAV